eukprot:Stramenopile-MAST_4_protein_3648
MTNVFVVLVQVSCCVMVLVGGEEQKQTLRKGSVGNSKLRGQLRDLKDAPSLVEESATLPLRRRGNGISGDFSNYDKSFQKKEEWKSNPYFKYFQHVWGNAPFIDSNFRLWLSGGFKNFRVGAHKQQFQTTKALPAYMHYYGTEYDPLMDPPYPSEESLYATNPDDKVSEIPEAEMTKKDLLSDCSQAFGPRALGYKRPCGVNTKVAGSYTREKHDHKMNEVMGKNTWWAGQRRAAGTQRGSDLYSTFLIFRSSTLCLILGRSHLLTPLFSLYQTAHKIIPPKNKPLDVNLAKGAHVNIDNMWVPADKAMERVKAPLNKVAGKPFPIGFPESKPLSLREGQKGVAKSGDSG